MDLNGFFSGKISFQNVVRGLGEFKKSAYGIPVFPVFLVMNLN